MVELVGKLTAKTLGWDRVALGNATNDTTAPQRLATIVGIVSGLRQTVNGETGDIQTGLKGNFRGVSTLNVFATEKNADGTDKMIDGKPVRTDTGKSIEVRSGVCYLPGGIQEMIEGALAQARETDPKATVSFGIDLFALKDTNKAGYTFKAETKVEATERDPLDLLMDQAKGAPALAAPVPGENVSDVNDANKPATEQPETTEAGRAAKGAKETGKPSA